MLRVQLCDESRYDLSIPFDLFSVNVFFEEDVHADDKQYVGEFLDGDCEDECSHFSKHVAMNFQL